MLLNRQQTENGHAKLSETWLCIMGSKAPLHPKPTPIPENTDPRMGKEFFYLCV